MGKGDTGWGREREEIRVLVERGNRVGFRVLRGDSVRVREKRGGKGKKKKAKRVGERRKQEKEREKKIITIL